MTWGLGAPAVLDALLTLAQTIPSTDVADGPKFTPTTNAAIVIGYSDGNVDAVEHTLGEVGYTDVQDNKFTVNCRTEVLIDVSVSTARAAAYALLGTFARLIYTDPTLGGAVMQASVTDVAYSPVQNERGYLATVRFGVTCDAYTL